MRDMQNIKVSAMYLCDIVTSEALTQKTFRPLFKSTIVSRDVLRLSCALTL